MTDIHIKAYEALIRLRNEKGIAGLNLFLPAPILTSSILFSQDKIKEIIKCRCENCLEHRKLAREGRGAFQFDEIAEYVRNKLLSVFALLVFIEKPVFIIPFWQAGKTDQGVLQSFGEAPGICGRIESFKHISDKNSDAIRVLEQQMEDSWTDFLRPVIGDPPYCSINSRHKLPIEDQQFLGSGVSGKVFAFKICPGYDGIDEVHGHISARKVIQSPDQEERNFSKTLNKVRHQNIAKLLATFQHQNSLHMIYPLSSTNLRHFLSDPTYGLGQSNFSNIFTAPLWIQARGIVDALQTIHNLHENKIGIHFDLKPENILVDIGKDDFRFLITDFGLAVFQDPRKLGHVAAGGGDEAYAPPEQTELTRKYDVWSMGCILLEILYFTLWEYEGIQKLEMARSGRYRPFWQNEDQMQIPRMQPGIQKAISELKALTTASGPLHQLVQSLSLRGIRFIKGMATLIDCMLQLDQHDRPTSKQVHREITSVMNDQNSDDEVWPIPTRTLTEFQTTSEPEDVSTTDIVPAPNFFLPPRRDSLFQLPSNSEEEYQPGFFRSIYGLLARPTSSPQHEDEKIVLQIFKRKTARDLSIRVVMSRQYEDNPIDSRHRKIEEIGLVPAYAFRKGHMYARKLAGIRLVREGDHESIMSHDLDGDLKDLRKVHGALMSQEIKYAGVIQRVRIYGSKSTKSRRPWKQGTIEPEEQKSLKGSITIQLWRETGVGRRECHLVLYHEQLIVIIRFSESLTFPSESKNPHTLKPGNQAILPSTLNKNAQPIFCSYIYGIDQHEPSLALDGMQFRHQCQETQQRFGGIELTFRNFEERQAFVRQYKRLKKRWDVEMGHWKGAVTESSDG